MKKVKCCFNSNCPAYKEIIHGDDKKYCRVCGNRLYYVCKEKNCFKQLPDDTESAYCQFHLNEHQDKKDQAKKIVKKVGAGVVAVGGFIGSAVGVAAKVIDNVVTKN